MMCSLVISLHRGRYFLAHRHYKMSIRISLMDSVLSSDPIPLTTSPNMDSDLAFTINQSDLRILRTSRSPVRLEIILHGAGSRQTVLGYANLDPRTASSPGNTPSPTWYNILGAPQDWVAVGAKPEILVSMHVEVEDAEEDEFRHLDRHIPSTTASRPLSTYTHNHGTNHANNAHPIFSKTPSIFPTSSSPPPSPLLDSFHTCLPVPALKKTTVASSAAAADIRKLQQQLSSQNARIAELEARLKKEESAHQQYRAKYHHQVAQSSFFYDETQRLLRALGTRIQDTGDALQRKYQTAENNAILDKGFGK